MGKMGNKYREQVKDGAFHHRMHRTVSYQGDARRFGFEWHGGAYIQVCLGERFASPGEVINVWSYATDGPTIPRTEQGMADKIDAWLADYGAENLLSDAKNW